MFNGHMDTSYSGREPWLGGNGLPAGGARRGRLHLRARDLEHEGRAGLLRRGGARAPGGRRAAARRRADRGRRRRDREDAVGRRVPRQGVPRLRGRLALSRHARRRRGHVPARRADRGAGRARPLRLDLAADLDARAVHPHGVQRRHAQDENSILRMRAGARRGARVDPRLADAHDRTAGKPGVVNVGAVRGGFPWRVSRTPGRTDLFLDVRVPPTMPMAEARNALGDWVRCAPGAVPRLRDRLGDLRDRARRGDRGGPRARPRDRRVAHGGLRRRRPSATRCAGSRTRAC